MCSLLLMACSDQANGEKMSGNANLDAVWQAVQTASSADGQRREIDAFLAMGQPEGTPPMQVSVKDLASKHDAPLDKALWENPQQYEVTLHFGDRKYSFVPRSRASLEPLFRE